MAQIAVLGTGHMGAPIASRLLDTGHQVTVWNRTAARTAPLTAAGAHAAATPAEAVRDARIVITMLSDPAAVDTVLFGQNGAAAALRPGSTLVEMSTIGPDAVRSLVSRLPGGVDLVDAPVSGGVAAAGTGHLLLLTGGTDAAVDAVLPVLEALGTVRRCGGTGTGAALKLVGNTALVTAMAALADSFAVARGVGVDPEQAWAVLAGGPLGGAVARARAAGVQFAISLATKDIQLALAAVGTEPAPVARAAARAFAEAPDQDADIAALITSGATAVVDKESL